MLNSVNFPYPTLVNFPYSWMCSLNPSEICWTLLGLFFPFYIWKLNLCLSSNTLKLLIHMLYSYPQPPRRRPLSRWSRRHCRPRRYCTAIQATTTGPSSTETSPLPPSWAAGAPAWVLFKAPSALARLSVSTVLNRWAQPLLHYLNDCTARLRGDKGLPVIHKKTSYFLELKGMCYDIFYFCFFLVLVDLWFLPEHRFRILLRNSKIFRF